MRAVIDVVLPVFGLILCGFLAGRFRLLGEASSEALNRFVYWFALPALLFVSMARVPAREILNGPFIAAYLLAVAIVGTAAVLVARAVFPNLRQALVLHGLTATFANTGYMGVPLYLTAFGPEGAMPAIIAAALNSAVMVATAIVLVELAGGGRGRMAATLRRVAIGFTRNPLVLAPAAGIAWSVSGAALPGFATAFFQLLGAAAGPCALFAMGMFLAAQPMRHLFFGRRAAEAFWMTGLKLLVLPAVTYALGWLFGLDPFWLASVTILSALPTGALAFVVAQQYGIYVQETSAVILVSTVLSVVTLSILFVVLRPGVV